MPSSRLALLALLFLIAGCGNMKDDLFPSNADKRPPVQQGTIGPSVGQQAPDFALPDTLGNTVNLSQAVAQSKGVVLYFTMWCPVCESDMSRMQDSMIPLYPSVRFFAVDYVSGSIEVSRSSQVADGFANSGFTVLADTVQSVQHAFNGTMGTTVVIDKNGIVQMNEDFKDGSRLQRVLSGLP